MTPLTGNQNGAMNLAWKHGYYEPSGRGGTSVLSGLVKRGYMEKQMNPTMLRGAMLNDPNYGVATHIGVLTEKGKAKAKEMFG